MSQLWRSIVANPENRTAPDGNMYTVYTVKSSTAEENVNDEWGISPEYCVEKRYSDFVNFRNRLQAAASGTRCPPLPKYKIIGRFDDAFIHERMEGLQIFLNDVHHDPVLSKLEMVHTFICREHTALVYRSYGGLDKLELIKVSIPALVLPTDILVKVHACSLNPADLKHRDGELKHLVQRYMPIGIGFDFSGTVAAVGSGVTEFVVGDEVFGDVLGLRTGTVAEYVVVDESVTCRKPSNLSHVEAAGAPLAGITALQCLEAGHMPQSGTVLITAGAGGVGTYAIQIAKNFYNAQFICTTASPGQKTDFVKRLGADKVIDYRNEDVVRACEAAGLTFDCVIDCTGEASLLAPLVRPSGGLVSILTCPTGEMLNKWMDTSIGPGVSISPIISGSVWTLGNGIDLFTGAGALSSQLAKTQATYKYIITIPDKASITLLRDLLESGDIVPQIDSQWTLSDAIEAARALEAGHAAGKPEVILSRTEGYLHKKGGAVNKSIGGRRNWKKRWFVLENAPLRGGRQHYELKYYEGPKGKLKGTVALQGTEIFCERSTQHNSKHVKYEFQILLQNGSMLNLSSDSFKERDEWIESINYAIASMKSTSDGPDVMAIIAGYNPLEEHKEEVYAVGRDIAQCCQAYGSGLFGAEAGQQAEFIVQLYSPDGQMLEKGGFPFSASLMDEECLYHIGIHDNENGSFSSFYVISRPGKYQLSILLNDEHHICGSPFTVEVHPSTTDVSMSVASGDALVKMTPDVISTFTVVAMDAFGNRKHRGGDPFELGVMGPAKLHGLVDNEDGTYTCSVEAHNPAMQAALTSASISIMVTLHGKHIHGSPFRPTIDMTAVKKAIQEQQKKNSYAGVGMPGGVSGRGMDGDSSNMSRDEGGNNKLEQARQRALEASHEQRNQRDRDVSPQELVARAMDANRDIATGRRAPPAMQTSAAVFPPHRGGNGSHSNRPNSSGADGVKTSYGESGRGYSTSPTVTGVPMRGGPTPQLFSESERGGGRFRGGHDRPPPAPEHSPTAAANTSSFMNSETKMKQRLSKLDKMTQKLGSSGRLRVEESPRAAPSLAPSELLDFLESGLYTSPPEELPNEFRRLWELTHEALRSREIANLIATNVVALQSSFLIAAETPSSRLAFYSGTERGVGISRLMEEFDVIPAYLNKKELKSLFQLILSSQTRSGTPVASYMSSKGLEGVDFISYLKLLVMVAIFCLSKTQAFNSLYPSIKAKVDVMLFKWGFAEPLKIRTIQDSIA